MFRVDGGVVSDGKVELFTDPEEAKDCAKLIIEECRQDDRYANPEHPAYDGQFAEDKKQEYRDMFDKADNLENVALNPDDDLIFLDIYGEVETSPDLSMLGTVTERMREIYALHETTWNRLESDMRTEFLRIFSRQQESWSNDQQFRFCLGLGLSYRHILHEMKCRGMEDRSFIKADYSLLFYLEDYNAWEEWSRKQEMSLMRQNAQKTGIRRYAPCSVDERYRSIFGVP